MKGLRAANTKPDSIEPANKDIKKHCQNTNEDQNMKDVSMKNVFSMDNLKEQFWCSFQKRGKMDPDISLSCWSSYLVCTPLQTLVLTLSTSHTSRSNLNGINQKTLSRFGQPTNSLQTGLNVVSIGLVLPLFTKPPKVEWSHHCIDQPDPAYWCHHYHTCCRRLQMDLPI